MWVLGLIWGAVKGPDFIKNCEDAASEPRAGSRAGRGLDLFRMHFPVMADHKSLIVFVESLDSSTVVCPNTKCSQNCKGEHESLRLAFRQISKQVMDMNNGVTSFLNYYNVSNTELDAVKCTFASKSGKATFMTFSFQDSATSVDRHAVIHALRREIIPKWNPDVNKYEMSITGFDSLAMDGSDDAIAQIIKIDVFTMPVAFALLGYMVRSWRLLLIAAINTGITLAFAFAFLAWFADVTGKRPLTTTSSLVEVLGLAMSIDYSLFLLRRFRDELKNGRDVEYAIKMSLMNAGHVVVLSSLTFCCVFLGFIVIPSDDLNSLGSASVVTIFTALVVCVTNTISLLNIFPDFFAGKPTRYCRGSSSVDVDTDVSETATQPLLGRTATGRVRHRRGAKYSGPYFRVLRKITMWPFNLILIVVVYGLSIPIAMQVFRLEHNQDVSSAISRDAAAAITLRKMTAAFPGGTLSPFYIVIEAKDGLSVIDDGPKMFKAAQTLAREIQSEVGADELLSSNIISPATLQGHDLTYSEAQTFLQTDSLFCKSLGKKTCAQYSYMYAQFASKRALLMSFTITNNPYGPHGQDFIQAVYRVFDRGLIDYPAGLTGDEVLLDADQAVAFGALPYLIGITLFIVFTLLGFGFKSLMTPIRLSLTVVLPLSTVFGFAVLVYQDNALGWMGWPAVQQVNMGFYWYVPMVALLQTLGLTLDYDVFCLSRIVEHRADGYEIQAAIVKAVWEVRSTIYVAGLIMAAAFSGLMLGDSTSMNQFGFLLCLSVLVDTFIVQTLLVPAIISFGDGFAWYPRKMPMEKLITLDDPEFKDE